VRRPLDVRARLSTGRPWIGTWSQFASEEVVDVLAAAGFEFTIADTEHGAFGLATASRLVRAAEANGMAGLVRVPRNDGVEIARALDAGAAAVVVPKIETAEAAAAAVAATRFEPAGRRGACPCIRDGDHLVADWPAFAAARNARAALIALVETPAAVAEADAIAATPGLAAILAGPFDLAVAMGHGGETNDPQVRAALGRVVVAARRHDLPVIMPVFDPEPARAGEAIAFWRGRGVTGFTVGTDKLLLATQAGTFAAACEA
jgi:4-hydroxy-2-oxoheptanedioate aldolase